MANKTNNSQLVFCILDNKEFLDYLLEVYLELGITGATVLQSQGMGKIIARDFPLFAGFKELLETGGPFNYTVMAVVHDPKLVDQIKEIIPNLKEEVSTRGVLFTMPVNEFTPLSDL